MLSTFCFKTVPQIKFLEQRWIAFLITSIFVLGSLVILWIHGLNLGIDFTGGIVIEAEMAPSVSINDVRSKLRQKNILNISLQTFGPSSHNLLIRIGGRENLTVLMDHVQNALHGMISTYRKKEMIGPVFGALLKKKAIYAIVLGLVGIFIYVWCRFDWNYALCGIFALIHDVIATIGLFSMTRMEFNLTVVAALLTIAGYSINDTIVIFDRVRENKRKYHKLALIDLYNLSINETLSRTLITSFVTLLAVLGLVIFGGPVLRGFSIAMAFGIVVGTYSSVSVALCMLFYLEKKTFYVST